MLTPRTVPTSTFTWRHLYVWPTTTDSLLIIINWVWDDSVSWTETWKLWNDVWDYVWAPTFTPRTPV